MIDDDELLRRYGTQRSESAFTELVERHLGLVYSAALRQVDGDASLAQEVTQSVFLDLARKASRLNGHTSLTGWLYTSVRFAASSARRSNQRRLRREQELHAMNELTDAQQTEADWEQLRPVLDEAMHALSEKDRHAILLRFFEGQTLAQVGGAFGIDENAARKRVERALEKLRLLLSRHGVALPAALLASILTGKTVSAVPACLVAAVAAASLSGTAACMTLPLIQILTMTKIKIAAGIIVGGMLTVLLFQHQSNTALLDQNRVLSQQQKANQDRLRVENERFLQPTSSGAGLNNGQQQEIATLRAEAVALNNQIAEKAKLREASRPEIPAQTESRQRQAEFGRAYNISRLATGEALIGYADAHDGLLPTNAMQLAPYMADELARAMEGSTLITNLDDMAFVMPCMQTNFGLDRFELLYQGRLKDLRQSPPEGVVVMREKQAQRISDSLWERIYFDGYGNSSIQSSPDGSFEKWESLRIPKTSRPLTTSSKP